jgi:hypothetical protein
MSWTRIFADAHGLANLEDHEGESCPLKIYFQRTRLQVSSKLKNKLSVRICVQKKLNILLYCI